MRVGLQAWGSEGDLRPVVALAAALQRAGHQVRVDLTAVDGTDYRPAGQALGIPIRMIPERLPFLLREVARDADSVDPLKISRELVERCFYPYLEQLYEAALELCAGSDLVVWHYASWYTQAAALKTGVPHVALHLFPGLAPTRTAAPTGLPNLGPLNPLLWSLARWVLDLQFRKRPAAFYAAHGLPPPRHVLPELMFSPRLNLHAISPVLCPPAPDWGVQQQVSGQLTLPSTAEPWTPSADLRAFLATGPRPVLFSFGSMEHLAPRRARELQLQAARLAGVRAILQTKRGEEEGRDGDLYFLPWAPHEALLPHCALVVHHAGAGTTHSVLRAGLPSVTVPFILEQNLWAGRLRAVGAAGRPLSFWKASAQTLASRVREAAASTELQERARTLGATVAREEGNRAAVTLLERLHSGEL